MSDDDSEEKASRKLAKKLKKAERENKKEKKEKKEKKYSSDTDDDKKEKKSKKRKLDSDSVGSTASPPSKSVAIATSEKSDEIPRRRTRSLSDAEEIYHLHQSPEDYRKEHQITVTGLSDTGTGTYSVPPPLVSFSKTPFSQPIRRALDNAGFTAPTPTQAQSWPIALSGRDIITVAKTGSGKTIGFLLPAFHRLTTHSASRKRGPPGILVLAPTRELACQIEEECVKFGQSSAIRSACCYGGSPKSLQIRKLQVMSK
jgi:ATP-dependent RNA helicase DDX5/DBP2